MGRWVTLDDDQHVYISDGGKVLATRGAISATAGGRERMGRMRATAESVSQRALKKAGGAKLSEQAARGRGLITRRKSKEAIARPTSRVNAAERDRLLQERKDKTREEFQKGIRDQDIKKPEPVIQNKPSGEQAWLERRARAKEARQAPEIEQQSPAAARAIEHARAAGPTLREQADRARAAKGTLSERTQAMVDKANKRYAKAEKTQNAIGVHVAAASRFGDIAQVNRLVATSAPYTRTKNRLMSHKSTINRLAKAARG